MANRYRAALLIQQGAVNPCGIAHALVEACRECMAEGTSQREDPAVRLIVHQLAYICNVAEIDNDSGQVYGRLTAECASRAAGHD
jgi:hypothetical protein